MALFGGSGFSRARYAKRSFDTSSRRVTAAPAGTLGVTRHTTGLILAANSQIMTCPTPLSGISVESSVETLVPRRQTFYGMDEVFVRAPCGTLVGLAAKTEGAEAEE